MLKLLDIFEIYKEIEQPNNPSAPFCFLRVSVGLTVRYEQTTL